MLAWSLKLVAQGGQLLHLGSDPGKVGLNRLFVCGCCLGSFGLFLSNIGRGSFQGGQTAVLLGKLRTDLWLGSAMREQPQRVAE